MGSTTHKAGLVSIVGKPNVGKSTLMNALIGEKLSIVTAKAQTTRHRIMGILNGDDYQIVYSDTPGVIQPKYELHRAMMQFVRISLEDADVILWMTDVRDIPADDELKAQLSDLRIPILLLINKIDLVPLAQVEEKMQFWQQYAHPAEIIPISAIQAKNTDRILPAILERLPAHPPYFPKDELTDKPERFFAAEIIREKIFLHYRQEVPYSCEVVISEFKDKEDIIVIRAEILVERQSQKGILIGNKGESLKKVGVAARQEMEQFFQKKVFLEQHVKVEPDWRTSTRSLTRFGYKQ